MSEVFHEVVLPTAVVIFPATMIALSSYLIAHLVGDLSANLQWVGSWAERHWWWVFVASVIGSLAIGGARFISCSSGYFHIDRRLRPLSGRAGEELTNIVEQLWRALAVGVRCPPKVRWFPNFNVMASANQSGVFQEIQVSSALWERAVRRDPIAVGILAHEMAHLVFRDGYRVRLMEMVVAAARRVMGSVTVGVIVTAAVTGILLVVKSDISWTELGWREAAVLAFMARALLIPLIANLTVRREAGLITALVEIRADACAGLWTNGLSGFARSLSQDPSVKVSSLADINHSLFSPDLTHVSNSERIALLSDIFKLATPKVRYFALSLALPFLIPLNPFTPLIEGGALDQMLVAAVVLVAHVTTVAMIVSAAPLLPNPLQPRLDLAQLNAESANLHLKVVAAQVLDNAIRVPPAEIPCFVHASAGLSRERIGHKPLGRQIRAVQIAPRYTGAADVEFAANADGRGISAGVEDIDLRVRYRPAVCTENLSSSVVMVKSTKNGV
jgi:hypothetical protein